jgi:glutamine synthetase
MSALNHVYELIKQHDIKFVDFRFTDLKGKWHHLAHSVNTVNDELFAEGVLFDGSSILGWKAINESDMLLMPVPETAVLDPFSAQPSLIIFCNVLEPSTGQPYNRDPRSICKRAEAYLKSSGIGDQAFFGPEAEFFIFDDVRYMAGQTHSFFQLGSSEFPESNALKIEGGNHGHRPGPKGGYFPVPPIDSQSDLRAEMLSTLAEMGVEVEKHHHEVAPAQHELGIKYDSILKSADHLLLYKYVVHNVAHTYGKTATFMPKPIMGENGSGMHVHQSIWKDGKSLFAGHGYADLSEMALYYIGGLKKHAKALNAFTNPSTNSYKRLVPGYEAPVLLAYSASNRSASFRIPHASHPNGKRVEVRFPDPLANPYLAFAAMLMAGLDGIRNRIHPGDPMDKNLYDLPPAELKQVPTVCGSLREALEALDKDSDFLKQGDVFTDDLLESYKELKWADVHRFEQAPHPVEFDMYYPL